MVKIESSRPIIGEYSSVGPISGGRQTSSELKEQRQSNLDRTTVFENPYFHELVIPRMNIDQQFQNNKSVLSKKESSG